MKHSPRSCLAAVPPILALGILIGCDRPPVGRSAAAPYGDASTINVLGPAEAGPVQLPSECSESTTTPPSSLVCTGLYRDIAAKALAPGVEPYAPAIPLWSDGASKQRWISVPAGEKIDNSDPNEWVFPVGTKVWKEFSKTGKRVETRLWQKVTATYWVDAAYVWNSDETAATRSMGGDIPWGTGTYHVPTRDECQKCHRGRTDRVLGFEQALLGLAGATGYTLDRLVADGRLTVPPASTELTIGDDGTGLAAPPLAWLHVNCGTTCHNRNSNSTAWETGLFLRLDPTELDGRTANRFDTLTTTVGVSAVSTNWKGQPRITPHDPAESLLYHLITHRGQGDQMPPIATSIVDLADVSVLAAWIEQMKPTATHTDGEMARSTDEGASVPQDGGAPP